jgi:hypothetical protein
MPDSIFLVGHDGSLTEALGTRYEAEADLQELLAAHPDLLPGAQINQQSPRRWLLVKREAGVPEHDGGGGWWSVDHLVVQHSFLAPHIYQPFGWEEKGELYDYYPDHECNTNKYGDSYGGGTAILQLMRDREKVHITGLHYLIVRVATLTASPLDAYHQQIERQKSRAAR